MPECPPFGQTLAIVKTCQQRAWAVNPNPYQHDDNASRAEKSGRVTPIVTPTESAQEAAMAVEAGGDRPAAALFNGLLGSVI